MVGWQYPKASGASPTPKGMGILLSTRVVHLELASVRDATSGVRNVLFRPLLLMGMLMLAAKDIHFPSRIGLIGIVLLVTCPDCGLTE